MGGLLNGRLAAKDKEHYLRVGDPDHRGVHHRWVLVESVLHLNRRDVGAAADDEHVGWGQ